MEELGVNIRKMRKHIRKSYFILGASKFPKDNEYGMR